MDFKPFENMAIKQYQDVSNEAAFIYLQNLLKAMVLPSMAGIQVKQISQAGFTLDEETGVITLNDPPEGEILAHMEDDDIHGSHAPLNKLLPHGIRAIATGIAASASFDPVGKIHLYHRTLMTRLHVPQSLIENYTPCVFLRIADSLDATVIEFGMDDGPNIYIKQGSTVYTSSSKDFGAFSLSPFDSDMVTRPFEFGACMTDTEIYFFYDGLSEDGQAFLNVDPPTNYPYTLQLLPDAPGVIMEYFRVLKGLRVPENSIFTPFGKGNFAYPHQYYAFDEMSGATLADQGDDGINLTLTANGERVYI